MKSLQQHRSFGHAWVYLHGNLEGQFYTLEGGHSGELGRQDPKYFQGVMNYIKFGHPYPIRKALIRHEPNPIKYLWSTLQDGFYQEGSGGHHPSYAIKVKISQEQFQAVLDFISPTHYDYLSYSLTQHQCTTFVVQIAALLGLILPCEITIPIAPTLTLDGKTYALWEDSCYSELTLPTPDALEKSLIKLVDEGLAAEIDLF